MSAPQTFHPEPTLINAPAPTRCRACVIVPARNEEATLPSTLDALAAQQSPGAGGLDPETFEVILLLNNCTDRSLEAARAWKVSHPNFHLEIAELSLPPDDAHVGWARRLLMDTAWRRLGNSNDGPKGILSTDADTLADPYWIANNLAALAGGADAVGGVIRLKQGEYEKLSAGVQQAYRRDRQYQMLIAELEDLLDPQIGDPWPRHLEHFGASLACTPEAYARAGGLPPVKPLEDVAFVDALRRSGARLRHDPAVAVSTSARLDGRAEIGLSHQLRLWKEMSDAGQPHRVPTVAALMHRFRTLSHLRQIYSGRGFQQLEKYSGRWPERIAGARQNACSVAEFLLELNCDQLIGESAPRALVGNIIQVNRNLDRAIARIRAANAERESFLRKPSSAQAHNQFTLPVRNAETGAI